MYAVRIRPQIFGKVFQDRQLRRCFQYLLPGFIFQMNERTATDRFLKFRIDTDRIFPDRIPDNHTESSSLHSCAYNRT